MSFYSKKIKQTTQISCNESYEAQSLEEQIKAATIGNQKIQADGSLIFTERKKGVEPQYNIRTDRFDLALDQIEKYDKMTAAQRDDKPEQEITDTTE